MWPFKRRNAELDTKKMTPNEIMSKYADISRRKNAGGKITWAEKRFLKKVDKMMINAAEAVSKAMRWQIATEGRRATGLVEYEGLTRLNKKTKKSIKVAGKKYKKRVL
ncbi:MAG: hypothetical protein QXO69_00235 [archaeon]